MYHVTINIPVEFDMTSYAESREKAIEAFWDALEESSDPEAWLMEHSNFDLEGVDWEKAVPYISGHTEWYIRDNSGDCYYFNSESEARAAAEEQDKKHPSSWSTSVEQVFVAYDEQGRPVDSLDSEGDYDD